MDFDHIFLYFLTFDEQTFGLVRHTHHGAHGAPYERTTSIENGLSDAWLKKKGAESNAVHLIKISFALSMSEALGE